MDGPERSGTPVKLRVDKWLWQARFFKTRSLAAKVISGGHLRINGARASKPAHGIVPGDVLTFPQAKVVRVVQVCELGTRRGPAAEAQTLYTDLSDPDDSVPRPRRESGNGRPTKRERRNLDLMKRRALEE
ncbi:heat shock protein Hsp15 [Salinihabitans flavidus]|uniref:Heat shock protein Hsp15 n=1 Tax=Salinihabitans flavidus TaxID=569882 RepID=A0A1H8T6R7_9RHOB|nr:RNA-binding S4 domain-containing protein [Salinihabitans flavidus]SEO86657.1 heat shock protein Hsp15 [Salinihabitans flavidus]